MIGACSLRWLAQVCDVVHCYAGSDRRGGVRWDGVCLYCLEPCLARGLVYRGPCRRNAAVGGCVAVPVLWRPAGELIVESIACLY